MTRGFQNSENSGGASARAGRAARRSALSAARSFPPVFRSDARVLILGSMPGAESLRRREYYAHPRNAFWPIMGVLFDAGPDLPYRRRLARLRAARVAVWDVLARCRRTGSLDAAIAPESARPNDIPALLRRAPRLRRVCFNGGAAERWFRRCFGKRLDRPPFAGLVFQRLPSTSPAHAGRSPAKKRELWRAALEPVTAMERRDRRPAAEQRFIPPSSRGPTGRNRKSPRRD